MRRSDPSRFDRYSSRPGSSSVAARASSQRGEGLEEVVGVVMEADCRHAPLQEQLIDSDALHQESLMLQCFDALAAPTPQWKAFLPRAGCGKVLNPRGRR